MAGSQDFAEDPRNADVLAYLDGELVPASQAKVSLFDAGFGMGDGVWEGLRLHQGALLFLDAHLDRLFWGAERIRIDIGLSREQLIGELRRLLLANAMEDGAHLRLMVTRGRKATINQDPRNAMGRATIACTAEFKAPPALPQPGLALQIVATRTTGPDMFDMRLNSHSRLNLIMALFEAIDKGADEAIMLDRHGNIASCNATNLFWVRGGTVCTSGDTYCFNGITRRNVLSLCGSEGISVSQGDHPPEALGHADEAFVTGTLGGLTAVRSINGRTLTPDGPVTRRLRDSYARLKDADAMAHRLV